MILKTGIWVARGGGAGVTDMETRVWAAGQLATVCILAQARAQGQGRQGGSSAPAAATPCCAQVLFHSFLCSVSQHRSW